MSLQLYASAVTASAGGFLLVEAALRPPRPGAGQPAGAGRAGAGRAGPGAVAAITRYLDEAGLSVRVHLVLAAALGWSALAGMAALAATGVGALALVAASAAVAAPVALLVRQHKKRLEAVRDAWPEALDVMVAVIRSGDSLPAALSALTTGGPELLRPRFLQCEQEYRATGDFEAAALRLGGSGRDEVARRVGAALALAHKVGGRELVRVLQTLASLVRSDQALRKEVAARQSSTVSTARAAAAAPWVILAMFVFRPDAAAAFRTPAGNFLIAVGALTTALGYRAMLALGRLPSDGGRA